MAKELPPLDARDLAAALASAPDDDDRPAASRTDWRIVVGAWAFFTFLGGLNASLLLNHVTDHGGAALHGVLAAVPYLLFFVAGATASSSLSRAYGRPVCIAGAGAALAAGTALCRDAAAAAPFARVIVVGRCLQGAGAGALHLLGALVLIQRMPQPHRDDWFPFVFSTWFSGFWMGPTVAEVMAWHWMCPWVFYPMFPICAAMLFLLTMGFLPFATDRRRYAIPSDHEV